MVGIGRNLLVYECTYTSWHHAHTDFIGNLFKNI